jgi:AraC family transcriptional regulator, positive regulator of tynA and feaB
MTSVSEKRSWSTDVAPGRELSYWREAVCDAIIELDIEADSERPFSAHLDQGHCGPVDFSKINVTGSQKLVRSRAAIAHSGHDQFELVYFNRCDGYLAHAGREVEIKSNQCVLIDGNRPYSLDMRGPSRNISVHIPAKWLAARLPSLDHAIAHPVDCNNPIGSALASLIGGMADQGAGSDQLDCMLVEQIVGTFCLALGPMNAHGTHYSNRLFERVRQTMQHLSHDQSLNAANLASELGISLRYLHAVFSQAGTTYGQELQACRLDSAARMLRDQRFRGTSINEIAYRAGYSEASHFSRRFKEAKGMTPAAYRGQTAD